MIVGMGERRPVFGGRDLDQLFRSQNQNHALYFGNLLKTFCVLLWNVKWSADNDM